MDGKIVDWKDAQVHVLSHTLHYGLGLFEGIRCYRTNQGSAIFRLKDHVNRLFQSAHIAQVKIPYKPEVLSEAIVNTVRTNELIECYIRPIVFIGCGDMGLYPQDNPIHVAIAAWSWGSYLGEEGLRKGIRTKIVSIVRNHVNSSFSHAKITGYYVNSLFAKREAKDHGYDEAILLDTEGYVAEGAGENLFIVRNGIIKTPPSNSILEGITRNSVIEIASLRGWIVLERKFTRDELYIADEVFLTGTAAEITPVREIDGRVIGEGIPGLMTRAIQSEFFEIVSGKRKEYQKWLTTI